MQVADRATPPASTPSTGAAEGPDPDGGTPVDDASASSARAAVAPARRRQRDWLLVVLGLPGAVALLAFQYWPLVYSSIAFQDYRPYLGSGSPWVAFDNFAFLWSGDPSFYNALGNTLKLTLIQTVFVFPVPLALALLLNSLAGERLKRLLQSVLYLPHFMSWVIVVALFQQMFGATGMLNTFLLEHDLSVLRVIGVPELFHAMLTSQVIWKDAGWGTIIFLAALSQVDTELYEAAAADGAGPWRRMWHITLPSLRSLLILLLILRLGDSLSVGFEQIVLQQGPVGLAASEVLDTWVYNNGILGGNWGMATAVGLFKTVVGALLVVGANKVAHMFGEPGVYSRA
jgi:putative aldouronate transport system permease protein